jgi:hypothetical protein
MLDKKMNVLVCNAPGDFSYEEKLIPNLSINAKLLIESDASIEVTIYIF